MKGIVVKITFASLLGLFGCAKSEPQPVKPEKTAAELKIAKEEKIEADYKEKVNVLARQAEPEVLKEVGKTLSEYRETYAKDKAAYQFKVSRWGHWLELSFARVQGDKLQKYSTSVNLDLVTTVHLVEGRPPDEKGTIYYSVYYQGSSGGSISGWGSYTVPAGYKLAVRPEPIPYPSYTKIFEETKQGDLAQWGWNQGNYATYKTENYPRSAEDDQIYLDGIAVIYCPAGLGEKVYREILAAQDK